MLLGFFEYIFYAEFGHRVPAPAPPPWDGCPWMVVGATRARAADLADWGIFVAPAVSQEELAF